MINVETYSGPSTLPAPSIPIDALIAARDALLAVYARAAEDFARAEEALRATLPGENLYRLPRVEFGVPGRSDHTLVELVRGEHQKRNVDQLRTDVDRALWGALYSASGLSEIMSSDAKRKLDESLDRVGGWSDPGDALPPLTVENVAATFEGQAMRAADTWGECVESLYRKLRWSYKTNRPQQLGAKMVVSHVLGYGVNGSSCSFYAADSLFDLERALHVIARRPQPTYQVGLRAMRDCAYGEWHDVRSSHGEPLLSVKPFRNGNVHVRILDQEHVDELNRIMANRRPMEVGDGERRQGR